jgi:hypothetical protein
MRLRDWLTLSICGAVLCAPVFGASPARALPLASGLEGNCSFAGCVAAYWDPAAGGNGHYYAFVPTGDTPPNWDAARDLAAGSTLGAGSVGHLATLSSAAENAFIIDQVLPPTGYGHKRQVWLGGFQNDTPVKSLPPDMGWQWIQPEAWNYTNWSAGEPNDEDASHSGDERYLAMWVHFYVLSGTTSTDLRGAWNDEGLESQPQAPIVGFIVEYQAVPEPASALLALLGVALLGRRVRR